MDVYGQALSDYYFNTNPHKLWINTSYGEKEEMPVEVYFRDEGNMPELELMAISESYGSILDVGAGVGSHSLELHSLDKDVTALEVSQIASSVCKERGVKKVVNKDFFLFNDQKFDTLLLLMNGLGLCGTLDRLGTFLSQCEALINPSGQIILDSSDISYLYDGSSKPENRYFGEIRYQFEYKNQAGEWFNWLYVDQETLRMEAEKMGWEVEILFEDGYDQYLARLILKG